MENITTDVNGIATINHAAGTYFLAVRVTDLELLPEPVEVLAEASALMPTPEQIVFVMRTATYPFSVLVVNEKGAPLQGVTVQVERMQAD